jgi:hypothetical protein
MEKSLGNTRLTDERTSVLSPATKTRGGYDISELPKSIDLSHHLSELAKSRAPSPLKTFYKYFGRPGLLALAGGLRVSKRAR